MAEEDKTVFNEASLQMKRYDFLQMELHNLRYNPFARHLESGWCFNAMMSVMEGLHLEISAKLDDGEKEEIDNKHVEAKKKIQDLFTIREDYWNMNPGKKTALTIALFNYEKSIRAALNKHGISTPNREGQGGWD